MNNYFNNNNFMYYPEINDKNFNEKIFIKKEFNKNKIEKNFKTIYDICPNSKKKKNTFKLQPQQEFLRNYISIDTPYNGILIIHGTGVGKTCTAISIAEGFKESINNNNKKILVMLGRSIRDNFRKEIFNFEKEKKKVKEDDIVQCTGNFYSLGSESRFLTTEQKEKKIRSNISKYYEFVGYEKFSNDILKKTEWNGELNDIDNDTKNYILKEFSDRVIIIDEIQNIKTTENIRRKIQNVLEAVILYSKNKRLVLMSATPMFNQPQEIIYILNLLLINDNKPKINDKDIFDKIGNIKKDGIILLKETIKGYISYLRGENPITFPLRIYPENSYTPILKYDILGKIINDEFKLKYSKLINSELSIEQYNYYYKILNDKKKNNNLKKNIINNDFNNINEFNNNEFNNNENSKESIQIQGLLQEICNIVYPSLIDNKLDLCTGKDAYNDNDKSGVGALYITKKDNITKKKKYVFKYQKHSIFNKDTIDEKPFLDEDYLNIYSPKIKDLINYIKRGVGCVYVYSRFINSGALPIALALEQNGFERYLLDGESSLLEYKYNSKGGGGKRKRICYLCGLNAEDNIHNEKNKNYHKFKVAKYMILCGSLTTNNTNVEITKLTPHKATEIFSKSTNKYGEDVKVLIGTDISSQGLDFKNLRQVHLIEPWFNLSKHEQIIGRAIRWCSHIDLNDNERNTEIYQYAGKTPKSLGDKIFLTETIDEKNYRIAEYKDVKIRDVLRILKENAVDCALNYNANIFDNYEKKEHISSSGKILNIKTGDVEYSRDCDYKKNCIFKCNWMPQENYKINDDTYNIRYANSDIELAKKNIKDLYKFDNVYTLDQIVNYVNQKTNNIELRFIYKAIDILLDNKNEIINDKFEIKGYLIYRGDYYIFQPLDIDDTKIPILYRNFPIKTKNDKIDLSSIPEFIDNKIVKNRNNNINEKNNLKNILDEINDLYSLHTNLLEYTNEKNYYLSIIGLVCDRLNISTQINILKTLIEKNIKKNKLEKIENYILLYYYNHLLFDTNIKNIKNNSINNLQNIKGFTFFNEKYIYSKYIWIVDNIKDNKLNTFLEKNKKLNNIYGLILIKNKNSLFKIIDKTREIEIITADKKKSKRSEIRGRECSTFKVNQLINIQKELGINIRNDKKYRKFICNEIELFLRSKNYENKNIIWFVKEYIKNNKNLNI